MEEDDGAQDIVLMDIETKRQTPLVTGPSNDSPVGWTPDGRYFLFASERNPKGIWAQAVSNRKPQGPPTLVKANVEGSAVGLTRSGELYLGRRTFSEDVEVAPVDLGAGKVTGKPIQIKSAAERTWLPAWSADGRSLAYVLVKNGAENTVGIRSILTGIERELHLGSTLDRVRSLSWAPDGSFLVGWGRDLKGRYGIYRINANDGHVSPLVLRDPPLVRRFFWSKDGQKMYYFASPATLYEHEGDTDRAFMQWNESLGSLSPDMLWTALLNTDPSGSRALVIRPMTGGEPRELLRFEQPNQYDFSTQWAPDGRAVLVMKTRGDEKEVLFVPIDGTAPRKLDFDLKRIAEDFPWFTLSPDGRHIAYMVGDNKLEVWVMENLLSSLK
jgi:Tol biopolymer transport system component